MGEARVRLLTVALLVLMLSVLTLAPAANAGLLGSVLNTVTETVSQTVSSLVSGEDVTVEVECSGVLSHIADGLDLLSEIGDALYHLQEEGVHGTLEALAGIGIAHSYVWIEACGHDIPLDPMWID